MVRAMVGGDDYAESSFNLATQGQRQPGSSFKPFVLAEALRQNISPELDVGLQEEGLHAQGRREVRGQQLQRRLRGRDDAGQRHDELRQLGLRRARPQARAEEGRRDGAPARRPHAGLAQRRERARRPQARASRRWTWRTRTRRSPQAASSPTARSARATSNRKVTPIPGPVGIEAIGRGAKERLRAARGRAADKLQNRKRTRRALPGVADQVGSILQTVVKSGTATRAFVPGVTSPARPARPRATATPGSSAGRRSTPSRSGSATRTASSRWRPSSRAIRWPAAPTRPASSRRSSRRYVGMKKVKKDYDRGRAGRPRPAPRPGASRTRRARPTRAARSRAAAPPPASTPVPQQEAPAEPAPEQEQAPAEAAAGAAWPSRRRRRPPSRRPTRAAAEPAPGTG